MISWCRQILAIEVVATDSRESSGQVVDELITCTNRRIIGTTVQFTVLSKLKSCQADLIQTHIFLFQVLAALLETGLGQCGFLQPRSLT